MNYAGFIHFPESLILMIFLTQWHSQLMPGRSAPLALFARQALLVIVLFQLPGCARSAVIETGFTLNGNLQGSLQEASYWSDPNLEYGMLHDFYQQRDFTPVWVSRNGPLPRANILLRSLKEAGREGLDSEAYSVRLIENLWNTNAPGVLARLELKLSNAALRYGRDLQLGRMPPGKNHPLWDIPQEDFDGNALLQALAHSSDIPATFAALSPSHPGYRRLRSMLGYYRQLALLGGWPAIPPGPTLRIGDRHPHVRLLREKLFIEGDLVLDISEEKETFDNLLRVAVERFQVRHGLDADGVVGPATREAMNISVEQRITQLKLNMERWRWLPRDLGQRYILVNIPAFQLTAYDRGKPVMVMEVIVGSSDRPTPMVSGELHSVVFNPPWTAPRIIVAKDLLPKQRRDPDFLSKRNIHVYRNNMEVDPRTVDWRKVSYNYLPYVLQQEPGPLNPMGRIKLLFHNRFDIYLHDTPQRSLFSKTERALSSGCIRLSQPEKLARFVLAENGNGWNEKAVRKALYSKDTQTVTVNTPLPVYLLYFTAWVGSDNRANFRNDIYQIDDISPTCPAVRELSAEAVD